MGPLVSVIMFTETKCITNWYDKSMSMKFCLSYVTFKRAKTLGKENFAQVSRIMHEEFCIQNIQKFITTILQA